MTMAEIHEYHDSETIDYDREGEPMNTNADGPPLFSLRNYLTTKAMMLGADMFSAIEAVASTAIEHPEWDLTEQRTWAEWESERVEGEPPVSEPER